MNGRLTTFHFAVSRMISRSGVCGLNFTKRSSFDWGSAAAPAAVRRALAPNTNVVARADVSAFRFPLSALAWTHVSSVH
jgi:hypothetical protein